MIADDIAAKTILFFLERIKADVFFIVIHNDIVVLRKAADLLVYAFESAILLDTHIAPLVQVLGKYLFEVGVDD